jgi:hypothetical protein
MNLGGATITGNLSMSSTAGNVSFGDASVDGNLTASTQGGTVDMGNADVNGNLIVQTHGGDIVQSAAPGDSLQVLGSSMLNAGTGNIRLPNVPNQFGGPVSIQAQDVVLTASGDLTLATSTVNGNLDLTAATGSVRQSGPLTVEGVSHIDASLGNVVLDQANRFGQTLSLNAINATVQSTASLELGLSNITGQFTTRLDQGNLTQSGALKVSGSSSLSTLAGNIVLTDADNAFGDKVEVKTVGKLSLTSSNSLTLGKVEVTGDTLLQSRGKMDLGTGSFNGKLKVNSGGFDINQTGPVKFLGDTDFDAGNAKIDLFNPYNMWSGAILFKGGIILINHPVLMNAVNAGTLIVRTTTTMPVKSISMSASDNTMTVKPMDPITRSGPAVSVSVDVKPSDNKSGLITVALSTETAAPGRSFSFELDPKVVNSQSSDAGLKISQLDGKPLPEWLRYEPSTKTFTATEVPAGAFPLQLKVGSGGQETVMVIKESDTNP